METVKVEPLNEIQNSIAVQNYENGSGNIQWNMGLDDFELLTVIGRGSYAKVVQAEHKLVRKQNARDIL